MEKVESEVLQQIKLILVCLAVANNLAFRIFCLVPEGSAAHWGTASAMTQERLLRLVLGVHQAGQLHLILTIFQAWVVVMQIERSNNRRTTLATDWRRHYDSSSSYWLTNKCCKHLEANNKTIFTGWQCRAVVVRTEEEQHHHQAQAQTSTWLRKIFPRYLGHLHRVVGAAEIVRRQRPLLC
jgi:hypothetical protein